MILRSLKVPKYHFFLFGPRGTGKTTWLKQEFKAALNINLLTSRDLLSYSASPQLLRQKVEALPKKSRIVIDEIQKLPALLDEVHALIADYEDRYQFALTGSSSRKLKQENANLLAGRALTRQMFSLTSQEMNFDFNLNDILRFGTLPRVFSLKNSDEKIDFLFSYVDSYLKEEIQQEAVVRNLQSYHRYLKHAALMNGQVMNASSLSRDAGVARATVDGYFSIVQETLLGFFLPATRLKAKVKEVGSPKFYFFDCGVVRTLQNRSDSLESAEKGHLFETFILNEFRAAASYLGARVEFGYWATPSENEVDLVFSIGKRRVGVEIKSSTNWKPQYSAGLRSLLAEKKIDSATAVYCGSDALKDNGIRVIPVMDFLKQLHHGDFF